MHTICTKQNNTNNTDGICIRKGPALGNGGLGEESRGRTRPCGGSIMLYAYVILEMSPPLGKTIW